MPMLGDVLLDVVYAEGVNGSAKTTDHAVEKGADISDHVKADPETVDISGVVTGPDASMRRAKLKQYKNSGELLKYSYRNILANVVITNFKTTHDKDVKGGFKFNITLKEIKIANTAIATKLDAKTKAKVAPTGNKGLQQTKGSTANKTYVVKAGDTLKKISDQYKISASKLYDKNRGIIGDDPSRLYIGQKLIIPA